MNDKEFWEEWARSRGANDLMVRQHLEARAPNPWKDSSVPQEAYRIAQIAELQRITQKEESSMYPDAEVINATTQQFDTGDGTVTVAGRVDRDERTYDVRITIRDEVVVISHQLARAIASSIETVVSQVSHHEGRR